MLNHCLLYYQHSRPNDITDNFTELPKDLTNYSAIIAGSHITLRLLHN